MLWSINDRLGGSTGEDFEKPNHNWAFEIIEDVEEKARQHMIATQRKT